MEWGTVSAASMAGMVFSLIIVFGLPIALIIIVHKKTHAKITACLIGGGVFIAFAMILEQILHRIVFGAAGTLLQENIVLYALYGGLAAAAVLLWAVWKQVYVKNGEENHEGK